MSPIYTPVAGLSLLTRRHLESVSIVDGVYRVVVSDASFVKVEIVFESVVAFRLTDESVFVENRDGFDSASVTLSSVDAGALEAWVRSEGVEFFAEQELLAFVLVLSNEVVEVVARVPPQILPVDAG